MRCLLLLAFSSIACAGFLDNQRISMEEERSQVYFTGSLISFDGHTLDAGHTQFRPYLFVADSYGTLDHRWQGHCAPETFTIAPMLSVRQGVLDWLEFQVIASAEQNRHNGAHSTRFGDISAYMNLQVTNDISGYWVPDIKFMFGESFPTGDYDRLNPNKNLTDASGSGSYETMIALVFQKKFHVRGPHYMRYRFFASYMFPTKVSVKSFNRYGGGYNTDAKVHPGIRWSGIASFEYSMTRHFAFALDFAGYYDQKASFVKGTRGNTASGSTATVGIQNGGQFSIAPALEYNFGPNFGMIAGVWFSLAGHTSEDFVSGCISFVITR